MNERTVIIDNVDPKIFYGVNNCNINLIRNLFPKLRMAARGNVIKVIGEDSETADFEKKLKELESYGARYNKLPEDVIIDVIKGEVPQQIDAAGGDPVRTEWQTDFSAESQPGEDGEVVCPE